MKWEGNRESDNVEDRRGGGGGSPLGGLLGGRGIGIGTIVVALLGGWIFGINPLTILGLLGGGAPPAQVQTQTPPARLPADDRMGRFVSTVLADTEDVWREQFAKGGGSYQEPRLVLFRGRTGTGGCGAGEAAMGPFYCPADQKVYIDLAFYETLTQRLGAPGDFAQAYVIAHEVGHHVQNLLGISTKVEQMRSRASPAQANALSVRLELQADCFAGVWAHHAQSARQVLEKGDVEEAMNAAAKIGDDALQRAQGGAVVPESFTHGTSAQRQRWFDLGLQQGTVKACDSFAARNL
ncbi:MAG: neutral zinc metallopeptidase [Burkholderiaceae bacterium]